MPQIKRYHPVSHDFNRDPEVQELRRQSADWMGYVWLEMLAIADRNGGYIKGTTAELCKGFAWLSLSDRPSYSRPKIEVGLNYMLKKGWIEPGTTSLQGVTTSFRVCKYPEYHRTREQIKSHVGTKEFPPNDPNELPTKYPSKPYGPIPDPKHRKTREPAGEYQTPPAPLPGGLRRRRERTPAASTAKARGRALPNAPADPERVCEALIPCLEAVPTPLGGEDGACGDGASLSRDSDA